MAFRRASAPEPVQTTHISAGHEPASRRRVETKSRQRAYGNLARNCRITIGPNADDGYPVRDQGSASYIATFEPAAVFGDLVKAEGIRRGAGHVRQLTILGDGAAWICYPDVGIADLIPVPRLSRAVFGPGPVRGGFRDAGRDNQRRSRKSMMSSGGR